MQSYLALIHKDAGSDFGVSFPDFPGCVTAGRTLEEASSLAAEALAFHLDGLREDGAPIPLPATLDEIMRNPENRDGVAILVRPDTGSEIELPADLAVRIERVADRRGTSRAAFVREAAELALAREE